jgi:hypothetical protein
MNEALALARPAEDLPLLDAYSQAVVAVVDAVGPSVASLSVLEESARSRGRGAQLISPWSGSRQARSPSWLSTEGPGAPGTAGDRHRQPARVRVHGHRRRAERARPLASRAGWRVRRDGDLLVSFAGEPVETIDSLQQALCGWPPGKPVLLGLLRGGAPLEVTAFPVAAE